MQISPHPYLSNLIKHYLIFDLKPSGQRKFRHFTDGHNGIVFILKKNKLEVFNANSSLPETYVFGQILKNRDFLVGGSVKMIVVLFQPYGFFGLTGIPAKKFQNDFVDSSLVFDKEILGLNNRLKRSSSNLETTNLLNDYFTRKVNVAKPNIAPFLESAVQKVRFSQGCITVNELTSHTNSSERKIQRIFSEQIGISPKKFIQNYKLHYFLSLLRAKSTFDSLTQLSLLAGYYDQAHLIREFKKITGITPSYYLKSRSLAVNLIEIV